jgi:hypothetical protein
MFIGRIDLGRGGVQPWAHLLQVCRQMQVQDEQL